MNIPRELYRDTPLQHVVVGKDGSAHLPMDEPGTDAPFRGVLCAAPTMNHGRYIIQLARFRVATVAGYLRRRATLSLRLDGALYLVPLCQSCQCLAALAVDLNETPPSTWTTETEEKSRG